MAEDGINPRLTKLRVLGLEELERSKLLMARWSLYEQTHDDHKGVDWEGYERQAGETWIQAKMRGRGYVKAQDKSIPFGAKRPTCHSMLVGETVDSYTALLLGNGRQPAMRFVGDDASTEAITALFRYADFWPVMAEARKLSGAMGAAAVLPEVHEGRMSLRTLRPEHLYVEWSKGAAWVPELVIEQRRVTVEQMDKYGRVEEVEMWRTRAWDSTHAYAYRDILVGAEDPGDSEKNERDASETDIELDGPPVEHHAGRCPVIWLQNTMSSASQYGEADCEAIFEQVEQLDRSMSMVMRGSRANNDPTLVVADTQMQRSRWPQRAKGYGRSIELSDKGKASLLETSGDSISSSWECIEKLEDRASARVGTVSPNPKNAGAVQSGIALQILHRTETSRAGERRNPLGVAICQLAQVAWSVCKELGLRTYGSEGEGVEVPPREVPRDPEEDRDDDGHTDVELVDHELGDGGIVDLSWPKLHEPIPEELRTVSDALAKLIASRLISQETGVAYALKVLQADVDTPTEMERIKSEIEAKVSEFDDVMMPDVDEEPVDENEPAPSEDVAREAFNGIQTKELGNTFARAGQDLAPETAAVVITEAYPSIPPAKVEMGIERQVAFAGDKAEAAAPPVEAEQAASDVVADEGEPGEGQDSPDQ